MKSVALKAALASTCSAFGLVLWLGDEADLLHTCLLRCSHSRRHPFVAHCLMATYVQIWLRVLRRSLPELLRHFGVRNFGLIQKYVPSASTLRAVVSGLTVCGVLLARGVARLARPDCERDVNSSIVLRRVRLIQSLTWNESCRCALADWWEATRAARGKRG